MPVRCFAATGGLHKGSQPQASGHRAAKIRLWALVEQTPVEATGPRGTLSVGRETGWGEGGG